MISIRGHEPSSLFGFSMRSSISPAQSPSHTVHIPSQGSEPARSIRVVQKYESRRTSHISRPFGSPQNLDGGLQQWRFMHEVSNHAERNGSFGLQAPGIMIIVALECRATEGEKGVSETHHFLQRLRKWEMHILRNQGTSNPTAGRNKNKKKGKQK